MVFGLLCELFSPTSGCSVPVDTGKVARETETRPRGQKREGIRVARGTTLLIKYKLYNRAASASLARGSVNFSHCKTFCERHL